MTRTLQAATPTLILASASTARAAMLEAAGLAFEVVPAPVDEVELRVALRAEGCDSLDAATALAELKAQHVAARTEGDRIVLGADQLLECDGLWLEKPADRAAARAQLGRLGGRAHRLVSAVVAFRGGARVWHHVAGAEITLRALSPEFIEAYLDAAGEAAQRSVGAYELEGLGAQLVKDVRGDHFTVLGLPLLPLLQFLRDQGVLLA